MQDLEKVFNTKPADEVELRNVLGEQLYREYSRTIGSRVLPETVEFTWLGRQKSRTIIDSNGQISNQIL